MRLSDFRCWLGGHRLLTDRSAFKASCLDCLKLFEVTYSMAYGETVIVRRLRCGEYNCGVDARYGFAPEAGCPLHD